MQPNIIVVILATATVAIMATAAVAIMATTMATSLSLSLSLLPSLPSSFPHAPPLLLHRPLSNANHERHRQKPSAIHR